MCEAGGMDAQRQGGCKAGEAHRCPRWVWQIVVAGGYGKVGKAGG